MILNIIVLIFEVLYYSMFMYYARKEGKFWKYLLLFSLITIVLIFIGTNNLYSYLIFVLLSLYGLKYIVKINISLYDMFFIFIMLAFKILIEGIIYMVIYLFYKNNFILTMIVTLIKNGIVLLYKNKLNIIYTKLKIKWENNSFYIRYAFIIFMFMFIIFSVIFLLIK